MKKFIKKYIVKWEGVFEGERDIGTVKFFTKDQAQDFYNKKIDEFYEGIDDQSDYNNMEYTDYVTAEDGLDYEIYDNGETFTAYLRGYYDIDHFEMSIEEIE